MFSQDPSDGWPCWLRSQTVALVMCFRWYLSCSFARIHANVFSPSQSDATPIWITLPGSSLSWVSLGYFPKFRLYQSSVSLIKKKRKHCNDTLSPLFHHLKPLPWCINEDNLRSVVRAEKKRGEEKKSQMNAMRELYCKASTLQQKWLST